MLKSVCHALIGLNARVLSDSDDLKSESVFVFGYDEPKDEIYALSNDEPPHICVDYIVQRIIDDNYPNQDLDHVKDLAVQAKETFQQPEFEVEQYIRTYQKDDVEMYVDDDKENYWEESSSEYELSDW